RSIDEQRVLQRHVQLWDQRRSRSLQFRDQLQRFQNRYAVTGEGASQLLLERKNLFRNAKERLGAGETYLGGIVVQQRLETRRRRRGFRTDHPKRVRSRLPRISVQLFGQEGDRRLIRRPAFQRLDGVRDLHSIGTRRINDQSNDSLRIVRS